jgi:large conductance mechanosensitive channel
MWREFREFAMRGNVIDLAIGIIIGAAFTQIVNSLVNDIIMPPIGLLLGGVDFSDIFINLSGTDYPSLEAARAAGAPVIAIGSFINTVINFLIVAFVIFIVVKQINRLRGPAPAPEVATKVCPLCATTIPLKAKRCPNCTSELAA